MRYYKTIINTSSEKVLENATIKLRDYGYYNNNVIAAVNGYIYQNLKSGIYFLIYREEENGIYAGIAFDEKKIIFKLPTRKLRNYFRVPLVPVALNKSRRNARCLNITTSLWSQEDGI